MVAKILVDHDISAGRRLVETLDRSNVPIRAALWLYDSDRESYELMLAMPLYDEKGPIAAYRTVVDAVRTLPDEDRSRLSQINIVGPHYELIETIGKAIQTGPGISNIRLTGNSFDRIYVDDAWVYRLN